MELIPLRADFGVAIHGIALIDVAASDHAYPTAHAAFERHSVSLFQDQEITDDMQAAAPPATSMDMGHRTPRYRRAGELLRD